VTSALVRTAIRRLTAFTGDREPAAVDLADNTNLFGAPPSSLRALQSATSETITRYPGIDSRRLREALADYAGVSPAEIITGCGSDDVLDSTMRAFGEPGSALAYSDPTFTMVPVFATVNGLDPIAVSFTPDHDLNAEALLAPRARITYVCAPNNPTGVPPSPHAVESVLERASGIVIVDEAYFEYTGVSYVSRIGSHDRLIIARTLSKAFGMAGFRIGYGIASRPLIRELEKARGPYKTNGPGEAAAVAALTHDVPWVRENVRQVTDLRERVINELRSRGFDPIPSVANFVLVPVTDARSLAAACRAHGVVVRPMPALRGIGDAVRITIGPWSMMTPALDALDAAR
jgi:histidinol-phosphate aminotransferase